MIEQEAYESRESERQHEEYEQKEQEREWNDDRTLGALPCFGFKKNRSNHYHNLIVNQSCPCGKGFMGLDEAPDEKQHKYEWDASHGMI